MEYTNPIIEDIFRTRKSLMTVDYNRYRNHVYRVFTNCLRLDPDPVMSDKYAIAAAFHDIGIWTHHTFDYLVPSAVEALHYLRDIQREEWKDEITSMIYWHHKLTSYQGSFKGTVEIFRKADWVDVTLGVIAFGTDRAQIRKSFKTYPALGFHWFLIKRAFYNFLVHPLNPLPMFRK